MAELRQMERWEGRSRRQHHRRGGCSPRQATGFRVQGVKEGTRFRVERFRVQGMKERTRE